MEQQKHGSAALATWNSRGGVPLALMLERAGNSLGEFAPPLIQALFFPQTGKRTAKNEISAVFAKIDRVNSR
jgi:hypothetical protein